jgi:hypothetical protein
MSATVAAGLIGASAVALWFLVRLRCAAAVALLVASALQGVPARPTTINSMVAAFTAAQSAFIAFGVAASWGWTSSATPDLP